ncbi:MAG: hypothetical protein D6689_10695 [Deltaproteobacteria bacterium]|nr:MAG: hypothetical protein D6689_10695 [Deltaproteobacteria bacterium]
MRNRRVAAAAVAGMLAGAACGAPRAPAPMPADAPALAGARVRWAHVVTGPAYPAVRAVALSGGDTIAVGSFQREAHVAGHRLRGAPDGEDDAFAVRLSPDGQVRWARAWTGPGVDLARGVAVAPDGAIYVVGAFSRALSLGERTLTAAAGPAGFLMRIDDDGRPMWAAVVAGDGVAHLVAVAADADGAVAVGDFDAPIAVSTTAAPDASSAESRPIDTAGVQDGVAVAVTPDGHVRWIATLGGPGPDALRGVAVAAGDAIAVGTFTGDAEFAGRALRAAGPTADIAIARLAGADGAPRWARGFGGAADDVATAAAALPGGDIAVGGTIGGTALLGGAPVATAGGADGFVARYTAQGKLVWARAIGGGGEDRVAAVAVAGGDILAAGEFEIAIDLPGHALRAAGLRDGFVARLSGGDGAPRWVRTVAGPRDDQAAAVAADASGDAVAVAVSYGDRATVGDEPLPDADGVATAVVRIAP